VTQPPSEENVVCFRAGECGRGSRSAQGGISILGYAQKKRTSTERNHLGKKRFNVRGAVNRSRGLYQKGGGKEVFIRGKGGGGVACAAGGGRTKEGVGSGLPKAVGGTQPPMGGGRG